MKTVLFLLLIYSTHTFADNSNQEKTPTSLHKKNKKTLCSDAIERKLRKVLNEIRQYKIKHEIEKKKIKSELNIVKKNFNDYKLKKENEIKKLKRELYLSTQKLNNKPIINRIQNNKLSQELNIIKNKFHNYKIEKDKEFIKLKKQCYLHRKKEHEKVEKLENELYLSNQNQTNIQTNMHKIIKEMEPSTLSIQNRPWIEITVENDMNIYDLALEYYGDSQEYKKIYAANQHIIQSDYKIHNGMTLLIPITKNFREQPIFLNRY